MEVKSVSLVDRFAQLKKPPFGSMPGNEIIAKWEIAQIGETT